MIHEPCFCMNVHLKIYSFRFIVKMYNLKIFSFPLNKVHN